MIFASSVHFFLCGLCVTGAVLSAQSPNLFLHLNTKTDTHKQRERNMGNRRQRNRFRPHVILLDSENTEVGMQYALPPVCTQKLHTVCKRKISLTVWLASITRF